MATAWSKSPQKAKRRLNTNSKKAKSRLWRKGALPGRDNLSAFAAKARVWGKEEESLCCLPLLQLELEAFDVLVVKAKQDLCPSVPCAEPLAPSHVVSHGMECKPSPFCLFCFASRFCACGSVRLPESLRE